MITHSFLPLPLLGGGIGLPRNGHQERIQKMRINSKKGARSQKKKGNEKLLKWKKLLCKEKYV